jgi:hypothetical protein
MFVEEQLIGFLHVLGLRRERWIGRHDRVEDHDNHHAHQLYQISTLHAPNNVANCPDRGLIQKGQG